MIKKTSVLRLMILTIGLLISAALFYLYTYSSFGKAFAEYKNEVVKAAKSSNHHNYGAHNDYVILKGVEKEYDVYHLIRLYESQERSLSILRADLAYFDEHPDEPGSEECGYAVFCENDDQQSLPQASAEVEEFCIQTQSLNDDIFNASPYYPDDFNMDRDANLRTIKAVLPKFEALHSQTLEALNKQWAELKGIPNQAMLTAKNLTYIKAYEGLFAALPVPASKQETMDSINTDYESYIGGEENYGGGAFGEQLLNMPSREDVLALSQPRSGIAGDPLMKEYLALYDRRAAALKTMQKGWATRNKQTVVKASDEYFASTTGLHKVREKLEVALLGKVVISYYTEKKAVKTTIKTDVKLPVIAIPKIENPVYGFANTCDNKYHYFLFVIDGKRDQLVAKPVKVPFDIHSAIEAQKDTMVILDSGRLLFMDMKQAKITDQMKISQGRSIQATSPDGRRIYLKDGLGGSIPVDIKAKKVVDIETSIPRPIGSVTTKKGRQLIVGLEQTGVKFRYAVAFYDMATHQRNGKSVELPNTPTSVEMDFCPTLVNGKVFIGLWHMTNYGDSEVRKPGENIAIIDPEKRTLKTISQHPTYKDVNGRLEPTDIADIKAGPDGNVYILQREYWDFWVWILNPNTGKIIGSINDQGKAAGIAIGDNSKLYVNVPTVSENRYQEIFVYDLKTRKLIRSIPVPDASPTKIIP